MKSTTIECPDCGGHGGEGVYCEECLSTGHIVVTGSAAEVIDQLRADLAAATQRAEEAEAQALALQENIQAIAQDALNWVPLERWEAVMRRAEAAEAALAAVPVEAICKLRKYLSDDDDYSICREDGEKLSIGEIILFGDLFEAIDKWLDSQPEVQP